LPRRRREVALGDLPPGVPTGPHGVSLPLARRARPVPPRRPFWPTGPAARGTSPGRGRARRGPKASRDLRPLVNDLVASHGWEGPVSHPSHARVPPDQPVNGRLACAGRESAAPRTGPAPRNQRRGGFRCAGVPGPDPQRQVGYLVPVPSDRPVPGRGRAIGSRYWHPGPRLPQGPSLDARWGGEGWDRPRPLARGVHDVSWFAAKVARFPVRRHGGHHECGRVGALGLRVPWICPSLTRPARGSPTLSRAFRSQGLACSARLGSVL
jgi:hypothetical protein